MIEERKNELNFAGQAQAGAMPNIGGRALSTHYKIEAFPPLRNAAGEIVYKEKVGEDGQPLLDDFGQPLLFVVPDLDNPKWIEEFDNLVVNVGLNDSLDKHLKGAAYTAAWFVGLTDSTPTVAAADTMASHAGWVEVTAYDEATRPSLVLGAVAAQSVDNSAAKANFTISANGTVMGGAFITTVNTKGGATGILYGVGAFATGDKTLDDNDILAVTVTCTAAAA